MRKRITATLAAFALVVCSVPMGDIMTTFQESFPVVAAQDTSMWESSTLSQNNAKKFTEIQNESMSSDLEYANWQEAYISILRDAHDKNNDLRFMTVDVNCDGVPELVTAPGTIHAACPTLYTFSNGNVTSTTAGSSGYFYYKQSEGTFVNFFEQQNVGNYSVFTIENGAINCCVKLQESFGPSPLANKGFINDEEVTEEEFWAEYKKWDLMGDSWSCLTYDDMEEVTDENIRNYILETLKSTELAGMKLSEIVKLMGGSYEVVDTSVENYYYIKSPKSFPNVHFCLDIGNHKYEYDSDADHDAGFRSNIESDIFKLAVIEIVQTDYLQDDTSVTYQITDKIRSDATYEQCCNVLGDFSCRGSVGGWVGGDLCGISHDYTDENCKIRLIFFGNQDIYNSISNDGIVDSTILKKYDLNMETVMIYPPDNLNTSVQCGDNLYFTIDDIGNIMITGSGEMWDFDNTNTEVGKGKKSPFTDRAKNARVVCMEDTVLSVGKEAFKDCTKLESITLSKKLEKIGEDAFNSCTALEEIFLPESIEYIGERALGYHGNTIENKVVTNQEGEEEVVSKILLYLYSGTEAELYAKRKIGEAEGKPIYNNIRCYYLNGAVIANLTCIDNYIFDPSNEDNVVEFTLKIRNHFPNDYWYDQKKNEGIIVSFQTPAYSSLTDENGHSIEEGEQIITFEKGDKSTKSLTYQLHLSQTVQMYESILFNVFVTVPDIQNQNDATKKYVEMIATPMQRLSQSINIIQRTNQTNNLLNEQDIFNFRNNKNDYFKLLENQTYNISDKALNRLLSPFDNVVHEYIKIMRQRNWNGSCYGMSIVTALVKNGFLELSSLGLTPNIYKLSLPKNDSEVENLIKAIPHKRQCVRCATDFSADCTVTTT